MTVLLHISLLGLGLPTQLKQGKIVLLGAHNVCKAGQELTADAAQILKLLNIKMAEFRIVPRMSWSKATKKVADH